MANNYSIRRYDARHTWRRPPMGLRRATDGHIWIDRDYEAELKRLGLATFDSVMRNSRGRLLRTLPDRENWRLELAGQGGQHVLYLKKHRDHSLVGRLRTWIAGRRRATAGRIEAENVAALARAGIESMRVVAFGEQVHGGVAESFFMTAELQGFSELDHFIRRRFVPAAERTRRDNELNSLAIAVADVARRFHAAGFNHRDFYCCHFFIQEISEGQFAVRLIDLQRVECRRWLRRRWIVKDLAQLAYSAPCERVTNTVRMRFIKQYLGVDRLSRSDKALVRRILGRQQAMQRRLGAHP